MGVSRSSLCDLICGAQYPIPNGLRVENRKLNKTQKIRGMNLLAGKSFKSPFPGTNKLQMLIAVDSYTTLYFHDIDMPIKTKAFERCSVPPSR